jgi:hypothetical protein
MKTFAKTMLISDCTAPPRNLYRPLPPRLPHELHLLALLPLLRLPNNNHDHQPLFEKDAESNL